MRLSIRIACTCTLAAVVSGCASVKVMRVTDKANQPEGIPFYLPRPYVQVYEPFVVASEVFLTAGQLSADSKYLLLDNIKAPANSSLASMLAMDLGKETGTARVPIQNVRVVPSVGGGPQSGTDGSSGGTDASKQASKPDAAASAPAAAASAPAAAASSPPSPVGQFATSVTQSSVPFPSTLGRRFFDVVWLPDFDEKYVIQGTPGLGNANIGITMVQGWGLYGMDAKIDNNAIVKPLLDFYSTGLGALSQLAKSKILPASAISGGVQAGPGDDGGIRALPVATRVSVKIMKVSVVAPGLYPMLKPTEEAKAQDTVSGDAVKGNLLIPRRPYTNIAFNIYDVLVIEAARPAGDSPMNLQRYYDVDAQGNPIATPQPPSIAGQSNVDAASLTAAVNIKLKTITGVDEAYWALSKLAMADGKLTATASLTGGKAKPGQLKDMKALSDWLSLEAKVPAKNITLTEQTGGQ